MAGQPGVASLIFKSQLAATHREKGQIATEALELQVEVQTKVLPEFFPTLMVHNWRKAAQLRSDDFDWF